MLEIYLILFAALGLECYSSPNRNQSKRKLNNFPGSRVRSVHEADNLTAISEPII
jgi:hypothetical protein